MSILEKEGGRSPVHKQMYTRGVWGNAPPGNFRFLDFLRLLLVHSHGLCSNCSDTLATSKGGVRFDQGRARPPPPPPPPPK